VNAVTQATPKIDTVFGSHVALAMSLVPDLTGVCLLDGTLNSLGAHGDFTTAAGIKWVQSLGLLESDGSLLGVFCVSQKRQSPPTQPSVYANELNGALRPLLHCVHRDLVALKPAPEVVQILTERTMELEWLFNVTSNLKGAVDDC
jgi:hypothetical protein